MKVIKARKKKYQRQRITINRAGLFSLERRPVPCNARVVAIYTGPKGHAVVCRPGTESPVVCSIPLGSPVPASGSVVWLIPDGGRWRIE